MTKEVWISANEAAEIISENSGRRVISQYVRELAQKGKIAYKPLDGRTNVYLRADVQKIKVRAKKVADRQKQDVPGTVDTSVERHQADGATQARLC